MDVYKEIFLGYTFLLTYNHIENRVSKERIVSQEQKMKKNG
jgi:hypothetical protein